MDYKKSFVPHLLVLVILFVLNAIYFYPAYSGKILEQDDIKLGVAKSKEVRDYRAATGEEALWTNSMFSGMPTFLMNIEFPNNIFKKIERATKLWQPAQIGLILFLMFGFYFLMISYRVNPWISAIGAFAFGFSAFFIISFDAGHNAKIRAAGYMAPMLMGILLTFRGKRWLGLAFTALFAGLAICANHLQITYYSVIVAVIIAIVELFYAVKGKTVKSYFKSIGVLLIAAILAIGPNASQLWTTYEYSQQTIRGGGGSSGLRSEKQGEGGGLDKDYAMSWSYGKIETLNLIIPNIMGGGSSQDYEGTETYEQFYPNIRANLQQQGYPARTAETQAKRQIASLFYWGDQSMVNGANYVGASIFFFFVLGLFLIRDRRRIWVVASVIVAVLMAWGKNLEWFNNILFEYLPLYNKFRVPSMTLAIVYLLMPFMGMLGLDYILKNYRTEKSFIKKSLLNSFYITGGFFLLMALIGPSLFSFEGPRDEQFAQNPQLLDMLIEDRKDLARSSSLRSLVFVGGCFLLVFLFLKDRLRKPILFAGIGALVLIDLWSFDKQHLNADDFVKEREYAQAFSQSTADQSILQDDGYYRVFNLNNPFNDAMTSYYHKAIGGYHGAKLQRYQELYEHVLVNEQNRIIQRLRESQGANISDVFRRTPVLNMLNGKYIIYSPQAPAIKNDFANGNAWFVQNVEVMSTARELVDRLAQVSTKNTALVHQEFADYIDRREFSANGSITFGSYDPKKLTYSSSSQEDQFAVFSEIYYRGNSNDWQAYIDDEPVDHIRVNYVLRAMKIPAGDHEIRFEFKPKAYYAGENISLIFSIILAVVVLISVFLYYQKRKKLKEAK